MAHLQKTESELQQPLNESTTTVVVYLAHLLVPLLVIIDLIFAWHRGYIERRLWQSSTGVATLAAMWLAAGLGVLLLTRDRNGFLHRIRAPLLSVYTIYLSLLIAELLARVIIPAAVPAVWPPGRKWVTQVDPAIYAGVNGTKAFTVNEIGLRGPSLPQSNDLYKIVTIGGSTTECDILDDSEEWPHLLMQALNRQPNYPPVWVANAGVSGHTTVDHLALLKTLPILNNVDTLIFLIGVNDLVATLAYEGAPTQSHLEAEAAMFREVVLHGGQAYPGPIYKRLRLVQLTTDAIATIRFTIKPPSRRVMTRFDDFRRLRASKPVVPLPDLSVGLKEYRGRVWALAEQCRVLAVRCLFLTQPSLWRSDLSPGEQKLIWNGYVGPWPNPKGYVSFADLASAMNAYNRGLLNVCQEKGLECYDLASVIPKNTTAFFDDVHFNENGARIVAQQLAAYILERKLTP